MKYANYCWVDVAFNGANKRNNLVDIRKVKVPQNGADHYRTVYRYPDAMREHFQKHNTVSGYRGYIYADWLPLDIDDDDLHVAHEKARAVLNQLLVKYEVNPAELNCFFSGAKGFHILIPAEMFDLKPDKKIPQAFKRLASTLFDDIEVDTSIYDPVRLFRFSNTINSKTGLYKIPLTAGEVLHETTEKILEMAKSPRKLPAPSDVEPNPILCELYEKALAEVDEPLHLQGNRQRNGNIKPCIAKVLEGAAEGHRNNAALRLAVDYAKQGMPEDMLFSALVAWNRRNTPPLDEKELGVIARQAVEGPYDFGCNDPLLKELCSSPCPARRSTESEAKPGVDRVKDIAEAYEAYVEYIRDIQKARTKLGFAPLDEKMRGIAPGEVCQIIARSAVGKTTLLLNILRNAGAQGTRPVLFFTMEMPLAQVFERLCQITTGKTGYEVERTAQRFVSNEEDLDASLECSEMASKVFAEFNHVYFVEDDGLSLEEIEEFYHFAERRIGEKPKVLAIDYMGRMDIGRNSAYEGTTRVAKGLKHLAKKLGVAVISLHQTSREGGGDGTEPVTIQSARDSGAVEEAADFLIGMWRPEKKDAVSQKLAEERVAVVLLKNRRGDEVKTEIIFHKPSLRMFAGTEGA